jgi:hypothetical protein
MKLSKRPSMVFFVYLTPNHKRRPLRLREVFVWYCPPLSSLAFLLPSSNLFHTPFLFANYYSKEEELYYENVH